MKKKKATKTTIALQIQNQSPSDQISMAISRGSNLEQLEKLLSLRERFEAGEATKAFNSKMATVHKEMPTVSKSLKNLQTNSRYAALDEIISKAKAIYTEHGFSVSFYEGDTPKSEHIRICADVIHCLGHKETYWYDVPMDGVGIKGNPNMTKIHAKSSSTSYAHRYLMCLIFNIPTGDDDDGNKGGKLARKPIEFVSPKERNQILDCLLEKNLKLEGLLKFLEVDSLDNLPKAKFEQAMVAIKGAKKK